MEIWTLVTGSLGGTALGALITSWRARRETPRLQVNWGSTSIELPRVTAGGQGIEVTVKFSGQTYDSITVGNLRILNRGRKIVRKPAILVTSENPVEVIDCSWRSYPTRHPAPSTAKSDEEGKAWLFCIEDDLYPGDWYEAQLLLSRSTNLSFRWRGGDEIKADVTGGPLSARAVTLLSLLGAMVWPVLFEVLARVLPGSFRVPLWSRTLDLHWGTVVVVGVASIVTIATMRSKPLRDLARAQQQPTPLELPDQLKSLPFQRPATQS